MIDEIESSQVDVVRMKCEIEVNGVRQPEKTIESRIYRGGEINSVIESIVTGKMSAYMWLLMIRADKIHAGLKLDPTLQLMEDTCFYVDLMKEIDSIKISDTVTYTYVINSDSATRNPKKFSQNAQNILTINEKFNNILRGEAYLRNMNAAHAMLISNLVFILGRGGKRDADFNKLIRKLHASGYRAMLRNSNLKFIPIQNAILGFAIWCGPKAAAIVIDLFSLIRGRSHSERSSRGRRRS